MSDVIEYDPSGVAQAMSHRHSLAQLQPGIAGSIFTHVQGEGGYIKFVALDRAIANVFCYFWALLAQFYCRSCPLKKRCTSSGCMFFPSLLPSESSYSPSKLAKMFIFRFTHCQDLQKHHCGQNYYIINSKPILQYKQNYIISVS